MTYKTTENQEIDILDVIARIRVQFRSLDMKPPSTILLGSHEEGVRFLSLVRQTNQWTAIVGSHDLGSPIIMADGSAWMELTIMDVAIRWPANKIATPDGSWAYV